MQWNLLGTSSLACFATIAMGLAGLKGANAGEKEGDAQTLRFAFITCCRDAAFFDPVKKGMMDAAEKNGR